MEGPAWEQDARSAESGKALRGRAKGWQSKAVVVQLLSISHFLEVIISVGAVFGRARSHEELSVRGTGCTRGRRTIPALMAKRREKKKCSFILQTGGLRQIMFLTCPRWYRKRW